ncbi:MAG: class II aldolase/adducin family protein [Candidatus Palauibacterales bacterium]|nr:class II aldolase/adducin family protein [Candidatus Palauibacterales bacterium]MDP2528909.1 class II aldolase/adducin family protein [Candidatus Palauibacterales bacterium]MDP2584049.1 class II aldolase/adducin family protein [Candidatus Palauibacterales bacterium]
MTRIGGAARHERAGPDPDLERKLRASLCRVGRQLHDAGLIAGRSGNLSVRLGKDRLLVTPRGVPKGRMELHDPVVVSLPEPTSEERARASTELPCHLACYRAEPGVGAVVHAHAPALTAAGLRGLDIGGLLPEVQEATGKIATAPFAPSGSEELAEGVGEAVAGGGRVVLLSGHGVLVTGSGPEAARDRLELAELSASACLLAREPGMEMDLRPVVDRYLRLSGGS